MRDKSDANNLSDIVARCNQVSNSPYLRKDPPPELKNLRAVLESVRYLTTQEMPALMLEIKRLKSRNKKLEQEISALLSEEEIAPVGDAPPG